ncbi:MAG: S-layer homology domain-containing protein, partial [Dorea sp.]|nr:S-layer homology domain-containing protein [Dorea sp.]
MGIGNISLAAEVPVDEAHFPDAAFRSYVSEKLDGNHDGQLSEEELASVTVISFEEGDAEGCESLEGMTFLYCGNNRLTNLKLQGDCWCLSCDHNELRSLDISGSVCYLNARFNYITEPSGNVVGGLGLEEMWSPRKSYTFVVNNSAQLLSKELFGDNLVMQGVLGPGNVFDNFEYTWFAPLKLKESEGIHYSEEDGGFYMDDFSGNSLHAAFTMENTRNGDIETIPVEIKRVPFADVNTGDWYAESAAFVNERGIMTGMNDTEFGPGVKLSRAQFATIL